MEKEDRIKLVESSINAIISSIRIRKWVKKLHPITLQDLAEAMENLTPDKFKEYEQEIEGEIQEMIENAELDLDKFGR